MRGEENDRGLGAEKSQGGRGWGGERRRAARGENGTVMRYKHGNRAVGRTGWQGLGQAKKKEKAAEFRLCCFYYRFITFRKNRPRSVAREIFDPPPTTPRSSVVPSRSPRRGGRRLHRTVSKRAVDTWRGQLYSRCDARHFSRKRVSRVHEWSIGCGGRARRQRNVVDYRRIGERSRGADRS